MKSPKLLSAIVLLVALSLFSAACKKAQDENQVENPAQQQQVIQALRDAYTAYNRGDIDAAVKPPGYDDAMVTVWEDGRLLTDWTFKEIRARADAARL